MADSGKPMHDPESSTQNSPKVSSGTKSDGRKHDKKKPFSCALCGTSYGRADVLQRHMKKCSQQFHARQSNLSPAEDNVNVLALPAHQFNGNYSAQGGQEPFGNTMISPNSNSNVLGDHFGPANGTALQQLEQQSASIPPPIQGAGTDAQFGDHFDGLDSTLPFDQALSTNMDFSGFPFDDNVFLEDSLLFQFNYNHSGLTVPSTPNPYSATSGTGNYTSGLQVVTPESAATSRVETSVHNALEVNAEDLHAFYENLDRFDEEDDLSDFQRPSLSRTLRCLVAYFQHFDPHTPLVHFASFSVAESHPALVTIMLAIGAVHLGEQQFAHSAYKAVSMLLTQHDKHRIRNANEEDRPFYLWYAQTAVLCAQFGVFAGDDLLFRHAQHHLFAAQTVMHHGISEIRMKLQIDSPDWKTWMFLETCSRVLSWLFVLSGMILAFDPFAVAIIPPLPLPLPTPSDESVWHAVSEAEWQMARKADTSDKSVDLWTLSKSVFLGNVPEACSRISAFTLLCLIGGFLTNITTRQRLHLDWHESTQPEYVADIERGLATWERLWRRHPRAEQSSIRLDHPLLNDCLSLLGSAYYHLYLGDELNGLKKIAEDPYSSLSIPRCSSRERAHKVIRYASNSWLVRAKLGITYLNKTSGVQLGSQALITAYETALLLAWWLYIQTNDDESVSNNDDQNLAALRRTLDEIQTELDEQEVCYDDSGNVSLSPIDFYVSLLSGWVWKCSTVIEQRLRLAQTRLKSE